jgi:DNA-nicking Smr family endonuclease
LRHQVPQWMGMSPLKQVILQITGAHISHGGTGAFYVYLRRGR